MLEDIRNLLAAKGIETQAISRHQLYFHQDVPYTSHNSSMCTEMDVPKEQIPEIIDLAAKHLAENHAPGSDPGLCLAQIEEIPDIAELISYGRRAKNSLLTKEEAYELAKAQNIHLTEHGGTGHGVIGALAGVALRAYGFDGRIKGKIEAGASGDKFTVKELLEKTGFPCAIAINGAELKGDEPITLTEPQIKAVRINWLSTIPLTPTKNGNYATLTKNQLKTY